MSDAKHVLRNNGLSLVWLALFVVFLGAQAVSGHRVYNQEQQEHGEAVVGFGGYLTTGHFGEAVFENWESEFLQMAMFVILTAFLFQKGAAESKDPEKDHEPVDEDPRRHRDDPDVPGPVRRGGLALKLYENSLSLVLASLFLVSLALHAVTGRVEYSAEQVQHGGPPASLMDYVTGPQFWFESFQNWQSEFMSVAALTLLSIWFRQRSSPESKPVAKPHAETGTD
ncbi:MAG TPA: DUF6766 family protein [Longimicrobium sp.]|nr:DUF6766 family protein [Longimicrobium sp.]